MQASGGVDHKRKGTEWLLARAERGAGDRRVESARGCRGDRCGKRKREIAAVFARVNPRAHFSLGRRPKKHPLTIVGRVENGNRDGPEYSGGTVKQRER